jgi:RNA polymerase sigma-70 factor (ECF subfamily)
MGARNVVDKRTGKGRVTLEDEIRLIRKFQKTGDRAAADRLIRKYFDEIYAYVYKQTSDKHTAMNLTQNVFIAVLQTMGNYDAKKASFRTWLYRIATNKTIDYYRSRAAEKNRVLSMEDMDIPDATEFTRRVERKDLLTRVQSYIRSLEMSWQQIFRLKFFGEYTFAQIAAFLDLPESTVKSKYYRLLKLLKEEFKDEYD